MRELSLNVMDVVQNSISAGASLVVIEVAENQMQNRLSIAVTDNGKGMREEQLRRVTDPFYTTRTTRSVGLGIPLFKMEAEMTGGSFVISSKEGEGTRLTAAFCSDHMDMIPLGDMNGTVHLLITCNPQIDFRYVRKRISAQEKGFEVDTRELRAALGEDVSMAEPEIAIWLKEFLEEQMRELTA